MTSSQRIALNTLATYLRSVVAMGLGLFSSRWILKALGEQDYGLYAVVGSIIIFITFLNGVTSGSVARFFAFSIGKGDVDETNSWFNTALFIHTMIPVLLVSVGWFVGDWAVRNFLNIPDDRLLTCLWVFRFSLIAAFVCMISTPYVGMLTAKQRIAEIAVWKLISAFSVFGLAYWLTHYKGDALFAYGMGAVAIRGGVQLVQVFRARNLFVECSLDFRKWFHAGRTREVLSFSGWQLFGGLGAMLRGQGTAILLNRFFDPVSFPHVNASYGIGCQISNQSQTFSAALIGAFTPEITSTEGRGEREKMLSHSIRASKYATFLIALFAVPLILEVDYVLELWLKDPPVLAPAFCRLMLIVMLLDKLTVGQMVSVAAKGKIAGYQVMLGGFLILTLPLAWLFLHNGASPVSVMWAFLITMSACSFGRVFWARHLVGLCVSKWFKDVFLSCAIVIGLSLIVGSFVQILMKDESFIRLAITTFATLCVNLLLGSFVVVSAIERKFIKTNILKTLSKLGVKFS